MKRVLLFAAAISIASFVIGQTITNQGAKIIVSNGTTLKFNTLHNSQAGGYFYYDTDLDIPGDWTNVSPATFNQGANGTVTLNGTSQQTIASGGSAFKDLTISNNTSNDQEILLGDDMEIETSLTLTDGIVNTNTNTLIFQSAATSNSGNAGSFVHGEMEKAGATQFTFPCGDVISRDLNLDSSDEDYVIWSPMKSNPSAATTVNVEYFFDNSAMPDWWEHGGNMDASLHHVSDREYYLVSSTEDFTDVTMYWNDNDHSGAGSICEHGFDYGDDSDFVTADLSVVYWNGSKWIDVEYNSGSSSLNHDAGYITSRFAVPFGAKSQTFITYGSKNDDNPLPVELISFTVDCYGNTADLIWQTASEINNKGFIIERSYDAENFAQIGFVNGSGNSNRITSYSFTDNKAEQNEVYYRLKQVDTDDKFTLSEIVIADCENINTPETTFIVYPNPFKSNINIITENLPKEEAVINIYNMLGSLIYQTKVNSNNGYSFTNIDLEHLPPAMYVVKLISGNYVGISKIEKH